MGKNHALTDLLEICLSSNFTNATHIHEFTFPLCPKTVLLLIFYIIDRLCLVYFSWKAANYSQFWGMSLDEGLRYRLGTQRPSRIIMSMNEIQVSSVADDIFAFFIICFVFGVPVHLTIQALDYWEFLSLVQASVSQMGLTCLKGIWICSKGYLREKENPFSQQLIKCI